MARHPRANILSMVMNRIPAAKGSDLNIVTSHYTREMSALIKETPNTRFPAFDTDKLGALMPGYDVWDSWYVNDEEGYVAIIHGYRVLLALAQKKDDVDNERIAVFVSKDNVHYEALGFLFEEKVYPDVREWSGSTILRDDGRLQSFYTISKGMDVKGQWQTWQRGATAIQNILLAKDGSISFEAPHLHRMIVEPDGVFYETFEQAAEAEIGRPTLHNRRFGSDQTENSCFRDFQFVRDPVTKRRFALFEANTGPAIAPAGEIRQEYLGKLADGTAYSPTADDLKANGCVGVLEFMDDDCSFIEFHPPWLTTNLVTDEIERIKPIFYDGHCYLFMIGHGNKNAMSNENEDLINRDYMLGFRASRLFGELTPMNKSGVVVEQKSLGDAYAGQAANKQYVYSWMLFAIRGAKPGVYDCTSYSNYCGDGQGNIIPTKSAGPTIEVMLNGLESHIMGMKYDILPK